MISFERTDSKKHTPTLFQSRCTDGVIWCYVDVPMCTCVYLCAICIHTNICTHTNICIHMYTYVYICIHIYIYTYMYILIYIYRYWIKIYSVSYPYLVMFHQLFVLNLLGRITSAGKQRKQHNNWRFLDPENQAGNSWNLWTIYENTDRKWKFMEFMTHLSARLSTVLARNTS